MNKKLLLPLLLWTGGVAADDILCRPSLSQRSDGPQIADDTFQSPIREPAFATGQGPKVLLDEAHANFHTLAGRYSPFVRFLRDDGFVVEPLREVFTASALKDARIVVIANATARREDGDAFIPAASAFTIEEISALRQWVVGGGSLLLIADHLPWGGDAAVLGEAFGLLFSNGYATDAACGADEFLFQRADDSLRDHPITRGRDNTERIGSVRTITGQAFRVIDPMVVSPLMVLAPKSVLLLPTAPWQFTSQTPRVSAHGMLQGAAMSVGNGRVAAFGEAAMFSAQVSGPQRRPMGMNMATAAENPQFLLNVMHWLAGLLPEK